MAETPEELMRSRYAAYARGNAEYVLRTWHPHTRPATLSLGDMRWTGLEVLAADGDTVQFVARYEDAQGPGTLAERSRFERRAGRWFYVDGDVSA
ncbi:UPF0225 protein [Microbacterium album]|uniref:UPF0225 protein n=2 Tax=Microbacterium album TaxID=2053191 RepID=A0A917IFY6_9MICO|nr:UPF0225 protein [Microbacterium album]